MDSYVPVSDSLLFIYLTKGKSVHLSAVFVALVSFCFSMTIGVAWEFFEFGMDQVFHLDMQKDTIVNEIHTVTLDPEQSNQVVSIEDISKTLILSENGLHSTAIDGYLDIGLKRYDDGFNCQLHRCILSIVYSVIYTLLIMKNMGWRENF